MNLNEALAYFLRQRIGELSEATRNKYQQEIGFFAAAVGAERDIKSITFQDVFGWYEGLHTRTTRFEGNYRPVEDGGLSKHTIDIYWRGVKAFFNWFDKMGLLDKNPTKGIGHKRPADTKPKRLSEEDVERLLTVAKQHSLRNYALIRFALVTGARRGGLYGLKVSDLDLSECSALVCEKGDIQRTVYYDNNTAMVLREWLNVRPGTTPYVWVATQDAFNKQTKAGDRISIEGLKLILQRTCHAAGVEEVGFHRLRHTFAYISLKMGIDPDLLRRQLGHTDIEITYRWYVQWDNIDQQEAFGVNRFNVFDAKRPRPARSVEEQELRGGRSLPFTGKRTKASNE